MRLSEAIESLCLATRANGRSKRTVQAYREKLSHLLAYLGDVDVENIETNDLRAWIADMRDQEVIYQDHPQHEPVERGLSPHTAFSRANHAKRLFSFLYQEKVLPQNPMDRISLRKPRRDTSKGVSVEDFMKLLEVTGGGETIDLRDRAIVLFLYDTGCRLGGLCRLRWGDVTDCLAQVIEKGEKTRYVPFSQLTREALQAWQEATPMQGQSDPVFCSLRAGHQPDRMTTNGVHQILTRRGEEAGCTGPVNPHAFRHGFARQFLIDGGDLASLSQLLGHADSKITTDYYAIFTVGGCRPNTACTAP
jgi:site-specific recombinase XerD